MRNANWVDRYMMANSEKSIPGQVVDKCKDADAAMALVCSRNREKAT